MNSNMRNMMGMFAVAMAMSSQENGNYHENNRRVRYEKLSESKRLLIHKYQKQAEIDSKNKHLKKFEIEGMFFYGSNYKNAHKKYLKYVEENEKTLS